ncbi:hypothetical protein ACHHYP_20637 [Achlya hypogyna]|uniref:Uncharacterized protein n=1 Tax=Achlya hypogyna TaxID=1202772 RepID=A0A1V9YGG2_ACHHY|nr:hypothetical protein ACHHYP_20637 [Achlya hypogyna]
MWLPVVTLLMEVVWREWFYLVMVPSMVLVLDVPLLPSRWIDAFAASCLVLDADGGCAVWRTVSSVKTRLLYLDIALFGLTQFTVLAWSDASAQAVCGVGLTLLASLASINGEALGYDYNLKRAAHG